MESLPDAWEWSSRGLWVDHAQATCKAGHAGHHRNARLRAEKPSLARGLPGGGTGLDALGPETTGLILLWLLLIGHGGSGVGRELLQVVLQQADFDTPSAHALLLRSVIGRNRRIAHADQIDPVDRNVMI